jgi:hypothetical protein
VDRCQFFVDCWLVSIATPIIDPGALMSTLPAILFLVSIVGAMRLALQAGL